MKRTALRRRTKLKARAPMRRTRIRQSRLTPLELVEPEELVYLGSAPLDRGELNDKPYLAWLRVQPGRSPDGVTRPPSVAHHARHTSTGASVGAHVKDDRRAISMSVANHAHIHGLTGPFKGWTKSSVRLWVDAQIAEQRAEYARTQSSTVAALTSCETIP